MDDSKETMSSRHNRTDTYAELTETVSVCTRSAQGRGRKNLSANKEKWMHKTSPLTKRPFEIYTCWERENQFAIIG